MKILSISFLSLVCLLLGVPHAAAASTPVVEELDTNGYYDMDAGEFTLDSVAYAGFILKYKDDDLNASGASLWLAHRPSHEWIFQHAGSGAADAGRLVMKLDASHQLLLYKNLSDISLPSITLNPGGVSSFADSVTLNGTSNTMPFQTSITNASILNISMGDARYMKLGINNKGQASTASGGAQVVIGQFNDSGSTPANCAATEDLFVIGNGTSDAARSNALVVKKSGGATFQGVVHVAPGAIFQCLRRHTESWQSSLCVP